jgi:uncharacterized protein with PQ loop repeat
MSSHVFGVLCGCVGIFLGVVGTFAQWNRARTVGVEGVSLGTWAFFVYTGIFWTIYGLVQSSWIVTLGSVVLLPMQISVVIRLRPLRNYHVSLRSMGVVFALSFAPVVIWGWSAGVLGTGVSMILNRVPQLVELVTQTDASGVSTATWSTGTLGSVVWATFYFTQHLHAAFWSNAATGVMNLSVMLLTMYRHRQARYAREAENLF